MTSRIMSFKNLATNHIINYLYENYPSESGCLNSWVVSHSTLNIGKLYPGGEFAALVRTKKIWAVVVDHLVERSLPIPKVCGSNPIIGQKLYWTFTVNCIIEKTKIKEKRPGMAHFIKTFFGSNDNIYALLFKIGRREIKNRNSKY